MKIFIPRDPKDRFSPEYKEEITTLVKRRWTYRLMFFALGIILIAGGYVYNSQVRHPANETDALTTLVLYYNPTLDPVIARTIVVTVKEASNYHHIDPVLYLAVLKAESNFEPRARNKITDAQGLGQWLVNPKKLEELGAKPYQVIHVKDNIWYCAGVLSTGFGKNRGVLKALYHYNGVISNVKDGNKYVAIVLSTYFDMEEKKHTIKPPSKKKIDKKNGNKKHKKS